jgi:hypothetical protein
MVEIRVVPERTLFGCDQTTEAPVAEETVEAPVAEEPAAEATTEDEEPKAE